MRRDAAVLDRCRLRTIGVSMRGRRPIAAARAPAMTAGAPSGTVTFLFTDIEGSTGLWERFPTAMPGALARHDAVLRAAVDAHGGHVFKTVGDAVCAVFARADAAVRAALAGQRALAAVEWSAFAPDFPPTAVRMGLHTGRATERDGDYLGSTVNRVARIAAAGNGGQILVSARTRRAAASGALPAGCRFRDLGEHRLRDLRHSEWLSQVVADEIPDVTRPLRTAGEIAVHERIVVLESAREAVEEWLPEPTVVGRDLPAVFDAIAAAVDGGTRRVVLFADQLAAAARHRPADWREYFLGRVAQWSRPQHRLDQRFVKLSLLVDRGESAQFERWREQPCSGTDLRQVLARIDDPAIVVLGPPGSGKSTLLRHLEFELSVEAVRGGASPGAVAFLAPLNQYAAHGATAAPVPPDEWLAAQWALRYPDLPELSALLAAGGVTLLLDGLNEMAALGEAGYWSALQAWKAWLHEFVAGHPRNRVIFSCRSLDYSQPLSSSVLPVPQVRIEPLSDAQIVDFLRLHAPARWREVWQALEGRRELDLVRSPFYLSLLVQKVDATGEVVIEHAGLLTGLVRNALRREVALGNASLAPGALLSLRDLRRLATGQWRGRYDLPDEGPLVARLGELGFGMQRRGGARGQVRIGLGEAADILGSTDADAVIRAGEDLALLEEDLATDQVGFAHQLMQEYFAARALAQRPDPEVARQEWRAAHIAPSAAEVLPALASGELLPPLQATGWEETVTLAAAMAPDASAFVAGLMQANLTLAGRVAARAEVRERLDAILVDDLRHALARRSRERAADVRARIEAATAVGALDDPRLAPRSGPHGPYLLPPLVAIPAGSYPVGDDAPIPWSYTGGSGESSDAVPRHEVRLRSFLIGQFAVTNAEWRLFVAAGGYDDERWWDGANARAWRRGELANDAYKENNRAWRRRFADDPTLFDRLVADHRFPTQENEDHWRSWMQMDDATFERTMEAAWTPRRVSHSGYADAQRFNAPTQPVVGVSWYEARAYCRWLSAQLGQTVRLPTEVEWEAAARGAVGRGYAWGDAMDPLRCNIVETRLGATAPVGVFPDGDTPEGVSDLTGNVSEWTSSAIRRVGEHCTFCYPYDPSDGREDPDGPADMRRVVRGGSWMGNVSIARSAFRDKRAGSIRSADVGLRLVVEDAPSPS